MNQQARWIYSALLYLYPAEFRRRYAHELTLLFVDMHRAAAAQGAPGVIDLWLHTCADLVFSALKERIMERSQVMFSPKIIFRGGLASAFGGLLWLGFSTSAGSNGGGVFALVLGFVLGLGGLASLYSRQAKRGGWLGLVGFALGITGTLLMLVTLWQSYISGHLDPTHADPASLVPMMLTFTLVWVTLGIGLALLGVASLRAKTLGRWWGLPLGLGLLNIIQGIVSWLDMYVPLSQGRNPFTPHHPEDFALFFVMFALLGLGWMVLGTVLAAGADVQVAPSPSASA